MVKTGVPRVKTTVRSKGLLPCFYIGGDRPLPVTKKEVARKVKYPQGTNLIHSVLHSCISAKHYILGRCSELVDYTRSQVQTDKFGLHFGLDYHLW